MSSSRCYLRHPIQPLKDLELVQQNWTRKARKDIQNAHYQDRYPPFHVSSTKYQVFHVHRYTTIDTMNVLLDHVRNCREFSLDTESTRGDPNLSLLQIHSIPYNMSSIVLLVELKNLPLSNSPLFDAIRSLLQTIFRFDKVLYAWGPLRYELQHALMTGLFDWPLAATTVNIQEKFSSWYTWALSQYETRRLSTNHDNDPLDSIYLSSPYRKMSDNWSLQLAVVYACHLYLDKSMTVSDWHLTIDPFYSPIGPHTRTKMIEYAINDVLAVTYLHRPVQEYWSFEQFESATITQLLQGSLPLASLLPD